MQTKEQIHNANLLQQAMEQQKIASKAAQVYEALAGNEIRPVPRAD
jgi:hypothetical protein